MRKKSSELSPQAERMVKAMLMPQFHVHYAKSSCDDCGGVLKKHKKQGWYYCEGCINCDIKEEDE